MFNGALSALITPFRDGAVDERALREIVEWQIQSGVDGVVACGSTGESATLTHAEHQQVIKAVRELTALGLRESKDLVDNAPKPILRRVGKETADKARAALERAGATVTIT